MQMENTKVKGLLVHELREETGGGAIALLPQLMRR